MRHRSKIGGQTTKVGRRKTVSPKRSKKPVRGRGSSAAGRESKVAQLTHELKEALEQQNATSEVLKVISSFSGELAPVFNTMLKSAVRICDAKFGTLYLRDDGGILLVASHNVPAAYAEARRGRRQNPPAGSSLGEAIRTKRTVHITDLAATQPYFDRHPGAVEAVEVGGVRTVVSVPLVKNDEFVGVISIYRQQVRSFTDKQVALVSNFAAQAVIAIENARLLNELRQRTSDLSEALEQQTATSEVLKVISSSPGNLDPVFQAMLQNATHICEAEFGFICEYKDGLFQRMAQLGGAPAYLEKIPSGPFRPGPETILGRVEQAKQLVQIDDLSRSRGYAERDPMVVAAVDLGGVRTFLGVPMFKDENLAGVILLYRLEVRPFTNKQIDLIKNFAAHAVIAIENAWLVNELNRLNQQLEKRVTDQVGEIERMGRLRRFLPPQVADLIVASGAEKQLESHRREITALFCDLRGFTGFSESSDPEDVMALLREYHAAIGEIISKYSGTLERYAGDGVMVIFNDPVPVPNPALQAVKMALDMRTAIGALIEKWRRLGHNLGFGIGIAHGFATLGTISFEGRFDYAAIGTVSNVASRLCDEAKAGQILISPRVLMAVENEVAVEPVGEFVLKGISRPMSAHNVLAAAAPETSHA
jgi:class 3 adenylate cyclase/putative methionine-R-sulfoxide reductase with GAF domain